MVGVRRRRLVLGSFGAVPRMAILAMAALAPAPTITFVMEHHHPRSGILSSVRMTSTTTRCNLVPPPSEPTKKATRRMRWEGGPLPVSSSGFSNSVLGSSSSPAPRFTVAPPRSSPCRGVALYVTTSGDNDDASPAFQPKFYPLRSLLDKILSGPKWIVWQLFRVLAYVHRTAFRLLVRGMAATLTAIIIDPAVNKAFANAVKDGLNLWITQPQFKEKLLRFQRNLSKYEGRDGEPSSLARPIGQDFPKVVLDFVIGLLSLPDLGNGVDDDDDVDKGDCETPFTEATLTASSHPNDEDGDDTINNNESF
eukprot:scaffold6596_cov161-Amphora_coffeaeformis.AAC.5